MKELFSLMSQKCLDGTLYGKDNLPENLDLFDKKSVSVIITDAGGDSLLTSSADSAL